MKKKILLLAVMPLVLACGLPAGKVISHESTPGDNIHAPTRKICVQADDWEAAKKDKGYVPNSDGIVCTTDVTARMWDRCQVGDTYPDCKDESDSKTNELRGGHVASH